jgi:hypothetical protein
MALLIDCIPLLPIERLERESHALESSLSRCFCRRDGTYCPSEGSCRDRGHFKYWSCYHCLFNRVVLRIARYHRSSDMDLSSAFLRYSVCRSDGPVTVYVYGASDRSPRAVVVTGASKTNPIAAEIVATQGLVAVVFPLASTVFNRASAAQQIAFVFITPGLKFIAKQLIANAADSLHEYIGLIVVFSVDLFNVFYVAICMQTAKTGVTTPLMIASDGFHVLTALHVISQRVNVPKRTDGHWLSNEANIPPSLNYFRDLPPMIRCVFGDSEISRRRSGRIRIFAPFPLALS